MNYSNELIEGQFIRRYKRFFAEFEVDGEVHVAHVPNTGSLMGCLKENSPCRLSYDDNPKRKLKYTLQMVRPGLSWIGINTMLTNKLVWEANQNGQIKHWQQFDRCQSEVKINDKSRLDLLLWKSQESLSQNSQNKIKPKKIGPTDLESHPFHCVEIKNVTLVNEGAAQFPDAVTVRGQKHLKDLMDLQKKGHSAEIFFVVQRQDASHFSPADDIDPEYGRLLREAQSAGVKVSCYPCKITKNSVQLDAENPIPIRL